MTNESITLPMIILHPISCSVIFAGLDSGITFAKKVKMLEYEKQRCNYKQNKLTFICVHKRIVR